MCLSPGKAEMTGHGEKGGIGTDEMINCLMKPGFLVSVNYLTKTYRFRSNLGTMND